MDFLNMWGWQPNGYFSPKDEQALAGTERAAPYWPSAAYANLAAWAGFDVGDEVFGGDAYAYVGTLETQQQLRDSITRQLAQVTESDPHHVNEPGIGQLVNGLYAGVANLWHAMAANYNTDWSQSG